MARYYIIDDYGNVCKTHDRDKALEAFANGADVIDTASCKIATETDTDEPQWEDIPDIDEEDAE